MCSGKEIFVIDFGLAEATNSIEDKAVDLLLMKRSVDEKYYRRFAQSYKKECREAKVVIKRLEEMEKRGRYQARTLA
jgi:tRNA A-37 threonylcarbamoyl transferase component Bud32